MKREELEQFVERYREVRPVYEAFAEVLAALLERGVRELGVCAQVQSRAKGMPNFAEKAVRREDKYRDPVSQFGDLCGARVVVETQDEIAPVCDFIRRHFEVDEAEDVMERLGAGKFGYAAMHFIVALRPGEQDGIVAAVVSRRPEPEREAFGRLVTRLYERRPQAGGRGRTAVPRFRAEIQVVTMLQHAWAAISHDRIYKTNIDVPLRWEREMNRVAATLEEADASFCRVVAGVERYNNYYGAYMTPEQREKELATLEMVLSHDPGNVHLRQRVARFAALQQQPAKVVEKLTPTVEAWRASGRLERIDQAMRLARSAQADEAERGGEDVESLRDPLMAAVLLDYGRAQARTGMEAEGRRFLEWAVVLDPDSADAPVALAETHSAGAALEWYELAHRRVPDDPRALAGLLLSRLVLGGDLSRVTLMRASLEAGIARCRELIAANVYIPGAYFDIGLFSLLLEQPFDAIGAYAKAVERSDSVAAIERALRGADELHTALRQGNPRTDPLPELGWVRLLLGAGRLAKLRQAAAKKPVPAAEGEAAQAVLAAQVSPGFTALVAEGWIRLDRPVVIVAGGSHREVEEQVRQYRPLLEEALAGFEGTVFSGGTRAGVPGMVGDLPGIRKAACLPQSMPAWTALHEGYRCYYTQGHRFSVLEPIQTWVDLLGSGVDPSAVCVLGVNGGRVAGLEYRLALAFGARVGVLRDSGRAAGDILVDPDWREVSGLAGLPTDAHATRIFLQGLAPLAVLAPADVEALARQAHEDYRKEQQVRHRTMDPAMYEWEALPEDLRASNLHQVRHAEEKLRAVGLGLRKIEPGQGVVPFRFSPEQVERLAEIEHGRWVAQRLLAGWTLGERDVKLKRSPYLVSWADLPEAVREWDRQPVRALPGNLAARGYEILAAESDAPVRPGEASR